MVEVNVTKSFTVLQTTITRRILSNGGKPVGRGQIRRGVRRCRTWNEVRGPKLDDSGSLGSAQVLFPAAADSAGQRCKPAAISMTDIAMGFTALGVFLAFQIFLRCLCDVSCLATFSILCCS